MAEALDKDNLDVGYRLGRLFAVFEKAQKDAANRKINTTIRDRYYASASSTPITVFSRLYRMYTYHIKKLSASMKTEWKKKSLEKWVEEIMQGINPDKYPPFLTLTEQGRFAIGYYHQKYAIYHKKNDSEKNELTPNGDPSSEGGAVLFLA